MTTAVPHRTFAIISKRLGRVDAHKAIEWFARKDLNEQRDILKAGRFADYLERTRDQWSKA